jgi:hypothetical protein
MQHLLHAVLQPVDRDTVSGDLLEEYREGVLPAHGTFRARLWYAGQVLSLLATAPAVWILAGCVLVIAAFARLSTSGPPWSPVYGWLFLLCGLNAISALRTTNVRLVLVDGAAFGIVFGAAMMLAVLFAVVEPLEQGHAVLLAYDAGRRQVLVASGAATLLAAGFLGGWRAERVGHGTLTAMMTSLVGFAVTVFLVTTLTMLVPALRGQLGPIDSFAWRPDVAVDRGLGLPVSSLLMLLMLSIWPGAIGATFGRGLGGWVRRSRRTARAR